MSAEVLRRAAALMRERAEAATPGPWSAMDYDDYPGDEGVALLGAAATVTSSHMIGYFHVGTQAQMEADGAHAASWHPAAALEVAVWLEVEAAAIGRWDQSTPAKTTAALAVARAYLGESS